MEGLKRKGAGFVLCAAFSIKAPMFGRNYWKVAVQDANPLLHVHVEDPLLEQPPFGSPLTKGPGRSGSLLHQLVTKNRAAAGVSLFHFVLDTPEMSPAMM